MTVDRPGVSVEEIRSAKEALIRAGSLSDAGPAPEWLLAEIDRSWRRSISAGAARGSGEFLYRDKLHIRRNLSATARREFADLTGLTAALAAATSTPRADPGAPARP